MAGATLAIATRKIFDESSKICQSCQYILCQILYHNYDNYKSKIV